MSGWDFTSEPANDWRKKALCRTARPEMFYPLGLEKGYKDTPAIDAAKAFCKPCPVRTECLAEAVARGEQWGIWGGHTPAERKHLRIKQILAEQFPRAEELAEELPGVKDRPRSVGRPAVMSQ